MTTVYHFRTGASHCALVTTAWGHWLQYRSSKGKWKRLEVSLRTSPKDWIKSHFKRAVIISKTLVHDQLTPIEITELSQKLGYRGATAVRGTLFDYGQFQIMAYNGKLALGQQELSVGYNYIKGQTIYVSAHGQPPHIWHHEDVYSPLRYQMEGWFEEPGPLKPAEQEVTSSDTKSLQAIADTLSSILMILIVIMVTISSFQRKPAN